MKNYFVFYTDLFIPKRFNGLTVAFLIFLRPGVKGETDLLEHEKIHVNQFWRTLGLNGLFYKLSKKYRLNYELEAYRKQLEFCVNKEYATNLFATYLSTNYNLNLTYDEAKELLKK
jgi:hypothetical protein